MLASVKGSVCMSEFESVFEGDGESEQLPGPRSEGKRKWAVYGLNEETYRRLLTKRQRGEKINFKERGSDNHQFTSAMRKPTPERLNEECGSGYFIIEHLIGGVAADWSFVSIPPSVAQVGGVEQVIPPTAGYGPRSSDPRLEAVLERLEEELGHRNSYSSRRSHRPRHVSRSSSRHVPDSGFQQQLQMIMDLHREASERERLMWQQMLAQARATAQAAPVVSGPSSQAAAPDNAYALFAPLAANNPTLAEKLLDRAFPQSDEESATWMRDILKHPQEAIQLLQAGLGLFGSMRGGGTSGGPTVDQGTVAPSSEQEAIAVIVTTLIDDVQKNRRIGRVADLIEEQCRRFPSLQPQVSSLLSVDCATLFQQIYLSTHVDLSSYAHAPEFVEDLRDELSESLSPSPDAGDEAGVAPASEVGAPTATDDRVTHIDEARAASARG